MKCEAAPGLLASERVYTPWIDYAYDLEPAVDVSP